MVDTEHPRPSLLEKLEKHGIDTESFRNPKSSLDNIKNEIINSLVSKVKDLEELIENDSCTYYSSRHAHYDFSADEIPRQSMAAGHVAEKIRLYHSCDFNPNLNTSSYVNVVSEPEEQEIALLGARVNLADASVYPASIQIHDTVVNMIARLWNAPKPETGSNYCGAGTVGSTEGCILAGLALKFRWREWYGKRIGRSPTSEAVIGVRPNLVISTCYQAAWEKFFKYFDVKPKFLKPNLVYDHMAIDASQLKALCDERTIGVVGILGNHYNGTYDPIWDLDLEVEKINREKGFQIGIHVDGASGGFVAPFQDEMKDKPFDFRCKSVLSISASGHKFGESICGTGWVVFRQREDLAEYIAVTVTYLGGISDSMTLNFSRPASGVYVQFYKLLRLGQAGFRAKVKNQMAVANFIRSHLREAMDDEGRPRFQIVDDGSQACLPVVAARLNPYIHKTYDDIDLQHALSESHWYVSGYALGFEDPCQEEYCDDDDDGEAEACLCSDVPAEATMFRIVVKSNLTTSLAQNLVQQFDETLPILDMLQAGYKSMHVAKETIHDMDQLVKEAKGSGARVEDDTAALTTIADEIEEDSEDEYANLNENDIALAASAWITESHSPREKLMGFRGSIHRNSQKASFPMGGGTTARASQFQRVSMGIRRTGVGRPQSKRHMRQSSHFAC